MGRIQNSGGVAKAWERFVAARIRATPYGPEPYADLLEIEKLPELSFFNEMVFRF
jgi:hypothetical protein